MSTDIILFVEKKIKGVWTSVDEPETDENRCRNLKSIYDDRNYELFAMLADVRNYYDIVPICEPRGLPDDVSPEVREGFDNIWCEGTFGWLTVAELKAYDWERTFEDGWRKKTHTYREAAGSFYTETIPKLERLARGWFLRDDDSVRIVFWLDG